LTFAYSLTYLLNRTHNCCCS